MKLKNFIRLLPLAHKPADKTSILDWRPFVSGDTLDEIVDNHNTKCIQSYEEFGWLPERIEMLVPGIDVVPHDLSTIDQLRIADYANIRILLVDLDAIQDTTKFDQIKERICDYKETFFVGQVSRKGDKRSLTAYFCGQFGHPSDPEILQDQKTLEKWLHNFCIYYHTAIIHASKAMAKLAGNEEYIEVLTGIAAKVRDASIIRGLSEKETVALARRAAIQECALAGIGERIRNRAQIRRKTKFPIILDGIREPVIKMPTEPFSEAQDSEAAELVELHLDWPWKDLTNEQRNIFVDLGIRKKASVAVHFDKPALWKRVNKLKDAVKITKFSADLPDISGRRLGGA
jgi:ribosomal protein L30/L7E